MVTVSRWTVAPSEPRLWEAESDVAKPACIVGWFSEKSLRRPLAFRPNAVVTRLLERMPSMGKVDGHVRAASLTLVVLLGMAGCGPHAGDGQTSVQMSTTGEPMPTSESESQTGPDDVGPDGTCGDGVIEPGEYCFERIEIHDIQLPSDWIMADMTSDGTQEIVLLHRPGASGSSKIMVARWHDRGFDLVAGHPENLSGVLGGLELLTGRPLADGPVELMGTHGLSHVGRYFVAGTGTFLREEASETWGGLEYALATFDIDGDGADELIVAAWEGQKLVPHVLRREPNETWTPVDGALPHLELTGGMRAATADLDGDGADELILAYEVDWTADPRDPERTSVTVLRLEGDGFTVLHEGPAGTIPNEILIGDLDHDGVPDLVVGSPRNVALCRGVGDGTFEEPRLLALDAYGLPAHGEGGSLVGGLSLGDLDGDGRNELLTDLWSGDEGLPAPQDFVIIEDALSAPAVTVLIPGGFGRAHALADLNHDGVDDILCSERDEDPGVPFQLVLLSNP
jgi:hypothetical protein